MAMAASEAKVEMAEELRKAGERSAVADRLRSRLREYYLRMAMMPGILPEEKPRPVDEKTFVRLALVTEDVQRARDKVLQEAAATTVESKESAAAGPAASAHAGTRARDSATQEAAEFPQTVWQDDVLNRWENEAHSMQLLDIQKVWDPILMPSPALTKPAIDSSSETATVARATPVSPSERIPSFSHFSAPQRLLISGHAGIGKSTLCAYIARLWSEDKLWAEQFDWIFWVPLRYVVDEERFSKGKTYRRSEVIATLLFNNVLTAEERALLEELTDTEQVRVLFVWDGWDEVANVEAMQSSLEECLSAQRFLLTSRPLALRTIPEARHLVTLGLTDDDIPVFIERYGEDAFPEAVRLAKIQQLQQVVQTNPLLQSIAHTPLHLGLLCALFANGKLSEEELSRLTLTTLYEKLLDFIFSKLLEKKSGPMRLGSVLEQPECRAMLVCLSHLAFIAMQKSDIVLSAELWDASLVYTRQQLRLTQEEELQLQENILKTGLVRLVYQAGGQQEYMFLHLTFLEFLAAYFMKQLLRHDSQRWVVGAKEQQVMEENLTQQRYNPRYAMTWLFAVGQLVSINQHEVAKGLVERLLQEPRDIVGTYEVSLVIRCLEEAGVPKEWKSLTDSVVQVMLNLVEKIIDLASKEGYKNSLRKEKFLTQLDTLSQLIHTSLKYCEVARTIISTQLMKQLVKINKEKEGWAILVLVFKQLASLAFSSQMIAMLLQMIQDKSNYDDTRQAAIQALSTLGKKAATPEVIGILRQVILEDESWAGDTRQAAIQTIGQFGEKAVSPKVIGVLRQVILEDKSRADISIKALGQFGEKAATPEVMVVLLQVIENKSRGHIAAIEALGHLGEKAATPEVISILCQMIQDKSNYDDTRREALDVFGQLGKKAATPEVMAVLLQVIGEYSDYGYNACLAGRALRQFGEKALSEAIGVLCQMMRENNSRDSKAQYGAIKAIYELGEKAATPEVIGVLLQLIRKDKSEYGFTRREAIEVLGQLGEKAATPKVIGVLRQIIREDKSGHGETQIAAIRAIGQFGKKAATPEVIAVLLQAIREEKNERFMWGPLLSTRQAASRALGQFGEKAATPEVVGVLRQVIAEGKHLGHNQEWAILALGQLAKVINAPTSEIITALDALHLRAIPSKHDVKKAWHTVLSHLISRPAYFLNFLFQHPLLKLSSETIKALQFHCACALVATQSAVTVNRDVSQLTFFDHGRRIELTIPATHRGWVKDLLEVLKEFSVKFTYRVSKASAREQLLRREERSLTPASPAASSTTSASQNEDKLTRLLQDYQSLLERLKKIEQGAQWSQQQFGSMREQLQHLSHQLSQQPMLDKATQQQLLAEQRRLRELLLIEEQTQTVTTTLAPLLKQSLTPVVDALEHRLNALEQRPLGSELSASQAVVLARLASPEADSGIQKLQEEGAEALSRAHFEGLLASSPRAQQYYFALQALLVSAITSARAAAGGFTAVNANQTHVQKLSVVLESVGQALPGIGIVVTLLGKIVKLYGQVDQASLLGRVNAFHPQRMSVEQFFERFAQEATLMRLAFLQQASSPVSFSTLRHVWLRLKDGAVSVLFDEMDTELRQRILEDSEAIITPLMLGELTPYPKGVEDYVKKLPGVVINEREEAVAGGAEAVSVAVLEREAMAASECVAPEAFTHLQAQHSELHQQQHALREIVDEMARNVAGLLEDRLWPRARTSTRAVEGRGTDYIQQQLLETEDRRGASATGLTPQQLAQVREMMRAELEPGLVQIGEMQEALTAEQRHIAKQLQTQSRTLQQMQARQAAQGEDLQGQREQLVRVTDATASTEEAVARHPERKRSRSPKSCCLVS